MIHEGLFSEDELQSGLVCRAFARHLLSGSVFIETSNGREVWVARFVCDLCLTKRITRMKPKSFEPISLRSPHRYEYTDLYDTYIDPHEARRIVMTRVMKHSRDRMVSNRAQALPG